MAYLLNLVYLLLIAARLALAALPAPAPRQVSRGLGGEVLGPTCPRVTATSPCLWLHAVSVGEVNLLDADPGALGAPASRLGHASSRRPRKPAIELAQQDDTPRAPSSTARSISPGPSAARCAASGPTLLVLAELELWPNLIAAAKRARREGRRRQRPPEREELSRLPADRLARRPRSSSKSI